MSGKKSGYVGQKAASQRTQLSGAKLNIFFISYQRLKTHKHLVSIGLSCSSFTFYEYFNRKITYAVFLYSDL